MKSKITFQDFLLRTHVFFFSDPPLEITSNELEENKDYVTKIVETNN